MGGLPLRFTEQFMKKRNKYRVEVPTKGLEVYEIESEIPLTRSEIMTRVSKKTLPDDINSLDGEHLPEVFVLEGEIDETETV